MKRSHYISIFIAHVKLAITFIMLTFQEVITLVSRYRPWWYSIHRHNADWKLLFDWHTVDGHALVSNKKCYWLKRQGKWQAISGSSRWIRAPLLWPIAFKQLKDKPPQITANHRKLPQTTGKNPKPPHITANHHKSPPEFGNRQWNQRRCRQTTTNHCKPPPEYEKKESNCPFFWLKRAKASRHVHFHSCSLHNFYIYKCKQLGLLTTHRQYSLALKQSQIHNVNFGTSAVENSVVFFTLFVCQYQLHLSLWQKVVPKMGHYYLNFKLTFNYKLYSFLRAWYPRCILLWMAR